MALIQLCSSKYCYVIIDYICPLTSPFKNQPDSGVVRLPCALGQEIFLRSPSTKFTEFELKNKCKSAEEAKKEYLQ